MRSSWIAALFLALVACSESENSSRDNGGGTSGSGASAGSGAMAGSSGTSGSGGTQAGSGGNSAGGAGTTSGGSAGASGGGTGGTSSGAGGSGDCSGAECGGEGPLDTGGAAGTGDAEPVFVAVGYDARRIRSTDLGETWIDEVVLGNTGADNEFLLRAVGFGNGVFVAGGYKIWTSPNGKDWEEQTNIDDQWIGGIQFGNGRFVATGGSGYCSFSTDGVEWQLGDRVPNSEPSRSLAFGGGKFVTATDENNWYESTDGQADWTLLSGDHEGTQLAYCNGEFKEYADCTGAFNSRLRATAEGVTVRVQGGKLERSTNGTDFSAIPNTPGNLQAIAVGFVE
jgi:hypothetical protein